MSEPKQQLPGKFVWFELVTSDARKAQVFYSGVLGWRVQPFPMGASTYDMIYAGDQMIGGYAAVKEGQPSRWTSYVSVENVDAAARAAAANGGKMVDPPADIPGAGRRAGITDPQGAELYLFKKAAPDPVDLPTAPHGCWLWNELHTTDPLAALAFYEKVVGFSHRSLDMGPGGTYHILSKGGVDRAGVTQHLASGVPPHWLPYVSVDDADAAIARARKLGGTIPIGPADIPNIGRFGILQDPTGAMLAIMKPAPMEKPQ